MALFRINQTVKRIRHSRLKSAKVFSGFLHIHIGVTCNINDIELVSSQQCPNLSARARIGYELFLLTPVYCYELSSATIYHQNIKDVSHRPPLALHSLPYLCSENDNNFVPSPSHHQSTAFLHRPLINGLIYNARKSVPAQYERKNKKNAFRGIRG